MSDDGLQHPSLRELEGTLQALRINAEENLAENEFAEDAADLRAFRPRLMPPLSRTDRRRSDSMTLIRPYYCPEWLCNLHKKLPWYDTMVKAGGGPWMSVRSSEVPTSDLWTEIQTRWKTRGDRYTLLFRGTTVFITLLTLTVLNMTDTSLQPPENVERIWDWFHQWFTPINQAVHNNEKLFSAMMIVASLMIDIVVFWILGYWGLLGDSMRLPIAYGMLYGIRSLIRTFTILPFPEGYIWGYPIVNGHRYHSLTVPFTIADDFFYSGHVGCATLAAIEHWHNRCWWGCGFAIATALVTAFLMCSLRTHYMIDMLTGAAMASWYHMVAQKIAPFIDQYLAFPPRPLPNRQAFMERARNSAFHLGSLPVNLKHVDGSAMSGGDTQNSQQ